MSKILTSYDPYNKSVRVNPESSNAIQARYPVPNHGERIEEEGARIRKLTEGECMRLMGFEEEDTLACKERGQSKTTIYHQAGDSIVTTVLMGIFGELLEVEDYRERIIGYANKLAKEAKGEKR